ncbi:MAG: putative transporter [Verrucomicrobia bacterium]|nr:putative transporter [Verrucomicrobiota bacterium]
MQSLSVGQPVAYSVLILSAIAVLGLALGHLKVRGLQLGVAGVLFAGIGFGHFRLTLQPEILGFVRDFGLILFVYTIGMQVGPGFFNALRRQGLSLNLLAAFIVLAGALLTLLAAWLLGIDFAAAVGIFAGATTNTPSLGAAQEALKQLPALEAARVGLPALGYAVAYPFGIMGIIFAMILVRVFFRIDVPREVEAFEAERHAEQEPLQRMNLRVTNRNLNGLRLHEIPGRDALGVIVSRVKYAGEEEVHVANGNTVLHEGDVVMAVGTRRHLHEFQVIVGQESPEDLMELPGPVTYERFVVTNREVLGRTLAELQLTQRFGVAPTRVQRAEVEMTAIPHLTLEFGDTVQVVGREVDMPKVATVLGNSVKELNKTSFIAIFLGILLGVLVGIQPFALGGLPMPVRLGLAGGPLLVAIVLSRIGRVGPLLWYMPPTANLVLRELGITLFLACAGLKAGEHFFALLFSHEGPVWLGVGAAITLLPLLLAAAIGRVLLRQSFVDVCGLLAGSMTDPPALAFANALHRSDAPSIAYATVYPLTMLLRILVAQLIVVCCVR